ncbi:MAG: Pyrimidine-specific ribonucleoside hydrolase RihB [Candidatus Moanabacter tarae]|uniref:Pyrimidine-specific ribonucleoside hydrolase RihB n=1 Tax=Candidatus Moanibacter tarae TaxID=2200854 RepID=A0A2Z4ACH6_9BACT|nr:MAG: Pyrimidine-specific ribonucleoside hydrolase RihB [Candidatus Moanabacter tarae]|tara:strand:- start:3529 stop:4536 length:1008 start_codon:yes stop_codon:yes gene_type:complete
MDDKSKMTPPSGSVTRRQFLQCGTVTLFGVGLTRTSVAQEVPIPEPQKVLFDTDIGSDIDDAVCLAYLLAQPRCELLGITTGTGESAKRAQLASVLCKVADQNIPIYPGTENPLIVKQRQNFAEQASKLHNWEHQAAFPMSKAISFLRDTIRSHPGEIILLAVGPLTNIALLFAIDPEVPSLLKGLVTMCGKFTNSPSPWGDTEWNAIVDPHATAIVFQSRPPIHRSIGLDVTLQVKMTPTEVMERFEGIPLLRPVYDFSKIWFEKRSILHFHDPLAAATLFNDQICNFEKGSITVDLTTHGHIGVTHWDQGSGPHQIASTVQPDHFFEEYFSVF